jgi:hypothetical protein
MRWPGCCLLGNALLVGVRDKLLMHMRYEQC